MAIFVKVLLLLGLASMAATASITILKPDGKSALTRGTTVRVLWNTSMSVNLVYISLFPQDEIVTPLLKMQVSGQSYYDWTIGSNIPAGRYYILVQGPNNAFISDYSQYFDIIVGSFSLSGIGPKVVTGFPTSLKWATTGDVTSVRIQLYSVPPNAGPATLVPPETSGLPVDAVSNSGAYVWTAPAILSGSFQLVVSNPMDLAAKASSPVFVPVGAMVDTVSISPKVDNGLVWFTEYKVQWTTVGPVASVSIDVIANGTAYAILRGGSASGSYTFTVNPSIPAGTAELKVYPVTSSSAAGRVGFENGDNTAVTSIVRPMIDIIKPAAGANLAPGTSITVEWKNPVSTSAEVGISLDEGATYTVVCKQDTPSSQCSFTVTDQLSSDKSAYMLVMATGEYQDLRSDRLVVYTSKGNPPVSNTGSIIGGVVGGVGGLATIAIVGYFVIAHQRKKSTAGHNRSGKRKSSVLQPGEEDPTIDIKELSDDVMCGPLFLKDTGKLPAGSSEFSAVHMPKPPGLPFSGRPWGSRRSSIVDPLNAQAPPANLSGSPPLPLKEARRPPPVEVPFVAFYTPIQPKTPVVQSPLTASQEESPVWGMRQRSFASAV
mmetsp:Transcript_737/g.1219  ORF Transcript_737/g.1219 Transcript_737/m.1219 type:complete len:603 (+) Transcript_737:199-2007(+)|eukprot:CAMPEP_0184659274 /NCGR_PEP_ID=MMETSP0308-20130426/29113_1 /TAXON_ID=38269 /ORGANISM="Gloeochaete witrockiana, Strain SAG 46.84" /LENGTH=602 /DNA_ID=CAMNT_0027098991 /DNA_START=126 /DNA_END=1934 /DNA_ORIENTATION=+